MRLFLLVFQSEGQVSIRCAASHRLISVAHTTHAATLLSMKTCK